MSAKEIYKQCDSDIRKAFNFDNRSDVYTAIKTIREKYGKNIYLAVRNSQTDKDKQDKVLVLRETMKAINPQRFTSWYYYRKAVEAHISRAYKVA